MKPRIAKVNGKWSVVNNHTKAGRRSYFNFLKASKWCREQNRRFRESHEYRQRLIDCLKLIDGYGFGETPSYIHKEFDEAISDWMKLKAAARQVIVGTPAWHSVTPIHEYDNITNWSALTVLVVDYRVIISNLLGDE